MLLECGFDRRVIELLLRWLGASDGVVDDLEPINNAQLVEELGRKQTRLLSMMDTAALTQPTPQQLAIAFGIITDKSLLYERQPTHIVTQEDRRAVDQVMLLLIKEARRRGIAIPKPPPQRHFASVEMAC